MVGSCENEGAFTRDEILRAREGGASLGTLIERDSAHALRLHVLASGSKGNAALIENIESGQVVAIDCGICKRDFFREKRRGRRRSFLPYRPLHHP